MKRMFFGILALGLILGFCMAQSFAASSDSVSTAQDIQSSNGNSSTFTGYLVDQICAQQGGGFDGSDLTHHPETHTLHCLKMSKCIASGFGIYVKGDNDTYVFYKFDKNGNDLALANVVKKTKKNDHILVTVTGKFKDNMIYVESISEK